MNVERWVRSRRPLWTRLEDLMNKAEGLGAGRLAREDLRDLGKLYRSASADLSRVRALKTAEETQIYLNNLVVKGHNQVYQRPVNRWLELWQFLSETFPALVREKILYVMAAFIIFAIPLGAGYCLVTADIEFAHMEVLKGAPLVSEQVWSYIEQGKMWTNGAQSYSPVASSEIATNNIKVAIMAFAYGVTFGIGTVFVLFLNGLMVGTTFGVCAKYGLFKSLLAFIAPHGVLELTAIFISGGAGLMLGKAMVFPGLYKRSDSLKLAAKPALSLFGGCIPLLLIAGTIEGFLSPRTDISMQEKFAISLATLICLLLYLFASKEPTRSKRIQ